MKFKIIEKEEEKMEELLEILNEIEKPNESNLQEELRTNAEKLVSTLQSFGVQTRIIAIARGPAGTPSEMMPVNFISAKAIWAMVQRLQED